MITENEAPGWDLLAEVALARRNRLGMTQRQVADAGGPSAPTVRALETQSSTMTPRSLRKLEAALGWKLGTTRTLINGLASDREGDWPEFVSASVHGPPTVSSGADSSTLKKFTLADLVPAHEERSTNEENEDGEAPENCKRYEQLDTSLTHATYLLSQLKESHERGNDAAFQETFTSLHHLTRSMHYSVMFEIAKKFDS